MVFFRRNKKTKDAAHLLFTEIVIQARNPHFYAKWGVADNIDGRFDLIILHLSLVINRLEAEGKEKKITELNIIAVRFDTDGYVTAVDRYTLDNHNNIDPVGKTTPTHGRELSFLQELFGNIGRFGAGGPSNVQPGN